MDINLYLEDWHDTELPDYERDRVLRSAVEDFNQEFGTSHNPHETVKRYHNWRRSVLNSEGEDPRDKGILG